ncbi:MAG: polyphosphate kinase 1 [Chitinophagaceae bacterium]|jgi:polyphosphate kinase|nr:polyphosphate kinase 1 [Chitinophagaceae bacterium]MBK7678281.1 polyphosphate kinase 1 [Chitinophagaceae bacterium]MBK9660059.1 polyphosphate kinase 1 [Chitinophagaceae bacterium]MBL0069436.1 polyphosphate kinase 1 [Chitinophagaceae bacterium]MBP6232390.1 polyphosphate kinase 1 [Chitinophagaceae bacterium]
MADDNKYVFLNRDLSWLSFNHRVLMEAADKTVPLYSRISFLSIFSSNLDEFFRVRMPSIFAFTSIEAKKTSIREEYPKDLVQQVQTEVHRQLEEFGAVLKKQILPELAGNHIWLYYDDPIRAEHKETVREYFLSKVLSFLQPIILRKENQSTVFLDNNALYFIVDMEAPDQPGVHLYAVLNIPSANLPRFSELPMLGDDHYILFLDDVIRENLQEVFPAFTVHGAWSIKLTRDAEMSIEDEFIGDIAEKIEKQLEKREVGHATRLLYDGTMPAQVKDFVQKYLLLRDEEMAEGGRYHNLKDLGSLPNPQKGKLTQGNWPSVAHSGFDNHRSIFQSITEQEKMLHLPYHSYNYILRFFNEAAIDPNVKEIYVTLYRVAADSHIVNALISAAKNGKKVTVFVELKARFDEANNLKWSKKMKAAGIKIINSIPGLKVHAKVALVKRIEGKDWKNYSFMATGNFNEATGRFYTDHVLFTSNKEFGIELEWLFDYLQSRKQPAEYMKIPFQHLLVSQFNIIKRFEKLIDREIKNAKKGRPAGIIIKLNNLQERAMIEKLYEASRAGVKVQLLVRSICSLAPGVTGQSENITVHRIVDRYLEHARVFVFHNNGEPQYFMGSADWMNRNLHSRIEVIFPVYDPAFGEELNHILQLQLNDNRKAVYVNTALDNQRCTNDQAPLAAQQAIYEFVKSKN